MGLMRSSSGNQWTQTTSYSGIQIQATSAAIPVPIIYGRNIIAPNIIWYDGFGCWASVSGKGSAKVWTAHYYADVIMGLCEGPIGGVGNVWQSSTVPTTLGGLGLTLATGATPQPVWPRLTAKYAGQALAYPGTAYVYGQTFNLGTSATVNSSNVEVFGLLSGSGFNHLDADPAQVVFDFLTNSQYGVGFPAGSISADSLYNAVYGYQTYCAAAGIAISPVLKDLERASSILARWLQITNSTAIWSDGMLKIIPFADAAISNHGASFTPNLTALYALSDEDLVYSQGEDPIQITRSDPYALANWQSVEIQSRDDNYNSGPVTAFDQSMIERFGLRVGSTVTTHEICDVGIGQTVAQLILQRGLYVRNIFKFKLSEEFCLLEPMDIVELTDAALGLSGLAVRITEIDEDVDGALSITAEEVCAGVATAVAYPTQPTSNGAPVVSVTPNAINAPLLFEPPPSLTGNIPQLWAAVSPQGGDANWGGCVVWASADGVSYNQVTTLYAAATQGVLASALPSFSGANPDSADSLGVDLTESAGALASTTGASAAAGVTMCYVGGEYLSFTTATLSAASQYVLTGLYRGQAGSSSNGASSGAGFCLLDAAIMKYNLVGSFVGQTIYLKFQSFNILGGGVQDVSACAAYAYTIAGTGALGAVTSALAVGSAMDFGHVAGDGLSGSDDYGTVASPVSTVIDLGNCSS